MAKDKPTDKKMERREFYVHTHAYAAQIMQALPLKVSTALPDPATYKHDVVHIPKFTEATDTAPATIMPEVSVFKRAEVHIFGVPFLAWVYEGIVPLNTNAATPKKGKKNG